MRLVVIGSAICLHVLMGASCAPRMAALGGSAVTIRNDSGRVIRDARVEAPGFTSVGGTIHPGTKARHFSPRRAPVGAAEVVWRDAGGKLHRQTVSVDGAATRGGHLEFAVRGDGSVEVRGSGSE